ncbi:MAG: hypothetical protein Q4G05_06850, partial [Clostridia bacterium]|nr:hypothetical protein [Clostridia bacterium]
IKIITSCHSTFFKWTAMIFYNILNTIFFSFMLYLILILRWNFYINIILKYLIVILLYIITTLYPLLFFMASCLILKNIALFIDYDTHSLIYIHKARKSVIDIESIYKINICFPFLRVSLNYFYKMYTTSGDCYILPCFMPIKTIKKLMKNKNENLEHVCWPIEKGGVTDAL